MISFLLCAVLCAEPTKVEEVEYINVCLTELWEYYDYSYRMDDNDSYELVSWAWTVELKSELSNGMVGWTYVGLIQSSKFVMYNSDENKTIVWWNAKKGKSGTTDDIKDAVWYMLRSTGKANPVEIDIMWR